jgi:type II secretory pathway pseudopilin PulG
MRRNPVSPQAGTRLKTGRAGRAAPGEGGYILLGVLFLVALVLISLAVAAPKIAADIQRDREEEMVHRGQQYVRAIKMYYKKFGAYPPNIDALVKTNQIRFLRKRYKDPMTGKDDWHLIHFGENKTPSYGFFGQPIGGVGGSPLAGVGPGGMGQGLGAVTQSNFGNSSNPGGSAFGSSSSGSSSFGGTPLGGSSGISSPGIGSTGGTGTDPNAPNSTGTAPASGIGAGAGSVGGTDANGNPTNGGSTFGTFGGAGQTFGGGGIIGVESTNPKLGILIWKKKTHFNEWEFWYDPNADRMMVSNNAGAIGTPAGAAGNGGVMGPGGINSTGAAPASGINPPQNQPIQNQPNQQQ